MLNYCSQNKLESHGESIVIKIREIATSLLEQGQEQEQSGAVRQECVIGSTSSDGNEEILNG